MPGPAAAPTLPSLGEQLRELMPSRRLNSISVWDSEANVVWLSEGALGPDEQTVVVAALEALARDPSLACHEDDLEDGRCALFLAVRAPTGQLVGTAMILADNRSVGDDTQERLSVAPIRAIMQRLAVLLKPAARQKAANVRVNNVELTDLPEAVIPLLELVPEVGPPPETPARRTPTAPAAPPPKGAAALAAPAAPAPITPDEVNDILEFELSPEITSPSAQRLRASTVEPSAAEPDMVSLEFLPNDTPEDAQAEAPVPPPPAPIAERRAAPPPRAAPAEPQAPAAEAAYSPKPGVPAAPAAAAAAPQSEASLALEVLPYAQLRSGGQTRRFQVQARLSARIAQANPAVLDLLILQRLVAWLAAHRAVWNSQPSSFTVPLSIATLAEENFAQKVAGELNAKGIAAASVGFEITEAVCTQSRAQVERFLAQCEKVGAPVVIDDFSFDPQVLPLLRSKAVRMVKIEPRLSASVLKDKLSQAIVSASVQAAKVLGIHCSAKRVDSQAAAQWLGAVGCDFGQGAAFAAAKSLESLAASPDATGLTTLTDRRA